MTDYADREVVVIARKQKAILWLIVASLACTLFRPARVIVAAVFSILVYQLAKVVRLRFACLCWSCAPKMTPVFRIGFRYRKDRKLYEEKAIQ